MKKIIYMIAFLTDFSYSYDCTNYKNRSDSLNRIANIYYAKSDSVYDEEFPISMWISDLQGKYDKSDSLSMLGDKYWHEAFMLQEICEEGYNPETKENVK